MYIRNTYNPKTNTHTHTQIIIIWLKKQAKRWNRCFPKQEVHMTNKYMVRCSTSLTIRKMQIKPQDIISHLLGWLLSKRQEIRVGEGVEKGNPCAPLAGMWSGATPWRAVRQFLWFLSHFWASDCLGINRTFSREVTSALPFTTLLFQPKMPPWCPSGRGSKKEGGSWGCEGS